MTNKTKKTPAMKKGMKLKHLYRIKHDGRESTGFEKGQMVQFIEDDGTDAPLFYGLFNSKYFLYEGKPGAFVDLAHVEYVGKAPKGKGWL